MRRLVLPCLTVLVLVSIAADVCAQVQTGEIFGRATDSSGAVLPGVTVTLESPALLQPRITVTSSTGAYRSPGIPIGVYT